MDRDPRLNDWVSRVLGVAPRDAAAPATAQAGRRRTDAYLEAADPVEALRPQIDQCGTALGSLRSSDKGGAQSQTTDPLAPLAASYQRLKTDFDGKLPPSDTAEAKAERLRGMLDAFGTDFARARLALTGGAVKPGRSFLQPPDELFETVLTDAVEAHITAERKGEKFKDAVTRLGPQIELYQKAEFLKDVVFSAIADPQLRASTAKSLDGVIAKAIAAQPTDAKTPGPVVTVATLQKTLDTAIAELAEPLKQSAARELQNLRERADRIRAICTINPATAVVLHLETMVSDLASATPFDPDHAMAVVSTLRDQAGQCEEALHTKEQIDKTSNRALRVVQALLNPKDRASLGDDIAKLGQEALAICAAASTIAELERNWIDLAKKCDALDDKIKDASNGPLEPDIVKADATQAVTSYLALIENLPEQSRNGAIAKAAKQMGLPITPDPGAAAAANGAGAMDQFRAAINDRLTSAGDDVRGLQGLGNSVKDGMKDIFAAVLDGKSDPALDAFVAKMGEKLAGPTTQSCCVAALEKRFGVKIDIKDNMVVTQLPKLYDVLKRLPPAHLTDNMKTITYSMNAGGGLYRNAGKADENGIAQPGSIEVNSLYTETAPYLDPENPDKTVEKAYLTAVTLHEIGHSVDDSFNVMKGHMNNADFGLWNEPSEDVVGDALYEAHFSSLARTMDETALRKLARDLLAKGRAVPEEYGALGASWDQITASPGWQAAVTIRISANAPWKKPALVNGDIAYHKLPDGGWVSYSVGARKTQAVSTYQYRAPGEWFAEIYSFYHVSDEATQAKLATKLGNLVIKTVAFAQ